jgi:hypothetical protein
MYPSDKVAPLYPEAWGSLFVALYDSQGYGGGILTRPHTGSSEYMEKVNNCLVLALKFP